MEKNLGSVEPIAVVGMACRFPGAPDISSFWRLLENGGNAVLDGLPESGPNRLEKLFENRGHLQDACRFCAYVDAIDQFDAGFFRISPVEAELLDPQQRMMLETSWQALEDAGMDPDRLKESLTGVYSGISNDEYRMLVVESEGTGEAAESLYALSGTNLNGTSGRVSFVLGVMGPAKAVDAACASSLVSVHDAVADLQQGKADLALAGGVQAILNSRIFELRADSQMLSPDGQCKAFDESANGYVRGEGCGVVVLKRLSDAEADGDRIWAVVRGAAVNHGGASVGLTVPHEPALERVIETALAQAGVPACDVDYLEAHGTGTAVGDPIEINAVSRVYSQNRATDRPLLVGSVKTNLGHLESAAGIAGFIKAVLVLQRGVIPKHLHFNNPSTSIDWDSIPLTVTSSQMDLPDRNGRPRVAGVNSFGISGTNAHIVVEEYPVVEKTSYSRDSVAGLGQTVSVPSATDDTEPSLVEAEFQERDIRLLPISAKNELATKELASKYLSWLDEHAQDLPDDGEQTKSLLSDAAWTAGMGRCHFEWRAGLLFSTTSELRSRLATLAETELQQPRTPKTVAFAYTGQGSQWAGMGQDLYEQEPVARRVLDRCEQVFLEERGTSLLDVMFGRTGNGQLGDTVWEQPALYALESAITALWASVGVHPDVVLGHSVGEIAAAQAANVFSLEDGMRFACRRGELLGATEPGAMAAIFAAPEHVQSAVDAINADAAGETINISADNGLHQVVSGTVDAVETLSKTFESDGIRVRRLNTTKAFHSALVEPALDELQSSLDEVTIQHPMVTLVSNLTGHVLEEEQRLDGEYWRRHARNPVAFATGARTLAELGVDLLLEIGPRSVLAPMAASAWPDSVAPPAVLSSIRPRPDDSPAGTGSFIEAVAEAYQAGLTVQFEGLFVGETRRRISIPGYPFQRETYWLREPKQKRSVQGHPLLGLCRESASGEITYETELFPSDPEWLADHRVYDRVIAPGALYGAMAAALSQSRTSTPVIVANMQLHNALVFPADDGKNENEENRRTVQVVLGGSGQEQTGHLQILSKGPADVDWILHAECQVSSENAAPSIDPSVDLESLKKELTPVDTSTLYQARAASGIELGPSFRTLGSVWARPGEALGEISLSNMSSRSSLVVHPLVLDGCFQVVAAARIQGSETDETTYLPFGWDQLWLSSDSLHEQVVCHVRMIDTADTSNTDADSAPEVQRAELRIYDFDGRLLGGLDGYTIKRATRAALFSALENVNDLLYEVVWRERPLVPAIVAADFLPLPNSVAQDFKPLADYLEEEGVPRANRTALLTDLENWSLSRACWTLETLGWKRVVGQVVQPEELRNELGVDDVHKRVFRRLLEMLARCGVVEEGEDGFTVNLGDEDPLPDEIPPDPDAVADKLAEKHPHGATEVGLFGRCGKSLPEVLRGQADPLTLLFSSGYPTPADLYVRAPIALAANRLLRDAVRALLANLPSGRHLRIVEVGAGTGSATASVLPELPDGRFEYVYTDISAGFFAEAESRFGDAGGCIEYRPLDIEKDPVEQGFDAHGYDLIIASNVLHATRSLNETLGHCLKLLAPSGQMVALENLRGQGWMDLTFGQLDGWWRFADDYRPHHALAGPEVWERALLDSGFGAVEVLGLDSSKPEEKPDRGVIVAKGPDEVLEAPGFWVLLADERGSAKEVANSLANRNQTVMLVTDDAQDNVSVESDHSNILHVSADIECRESWQNLVKTIPDDVDLSGVVHFVALDGRDSAATTNDMAHDVQRTVASALVLVQSVVDSNLTPVKGVWFITSGAQVLERETQGSLVGATLWGFGKGVAREAAYLNPRMVDLDPTVEEQVFDLVDELMYPDFENHIAWRGEGRQVARLVRTDDGPERLDLPEDSTWVLTPDPAGVFETPRAKELPARPLEAREVKIAVEAAGLNFWDVFRSLGFIEEGNLGREMCGHVVGVGSEVSNVSVGDHVVGLGFGAFAAEMITHEELVAHAPSDIPVSGLATIPSAFVSAALSYELSGLEADDRVLIHAGAGGVGLAAIQLAQAAGAEVFTTASAPKQNYLRSLGVKHVFDSRQTAFGAEILEATDGAGVTVVLNSLTSEGFIDASLSCLAQGGRFVELARRDILTPEEMAEVRPDVTYDILELDVLKKTDPEWVGRVLRDLMERVSTGELTPIVHSRWPLAEVGAALMFMRSARHLGKIVVTTQPLVSGRLKQDRTYLVTGGLGGIGLAVAEWLVEHGAGTVLLNGRRPPNEEAKQTIRELEDRGATIRVELADVSDSEALDGMLERVDQDLPPLAGVIHSVGVLSDGALTNQSWDRFETVLWPKVLGAWHLHRATADRDLDLFILFSSRVGVMGNPGQTNHAAANAFLDQLAGHRRALGLPGQAIAWGAWSEIGEAAEQKDRIERQRSALGGRWFTPQQGIRALNRLVRQDVTNSVVMAMDWSVFEEAVDDRPAFLDELLSSEDDEATDGAISTEDVLTQLASANVSERENLLVSFIQQELQAVLRMPSEPARSVGFFDLGMDSLMAVEFRNRLNRALSGACTVSNTVVFDFPNIELLASHLNGELGEIESTSVPQPKQKENDSATRMQAALPDQSTTLQVETVPQIQPTMQDQPKPELNIESRADEDQIAIVGMACRFPGAPDLESYWKQLEAGADLVTDGRPDTGPWNGIIGDPSAEESEYRVGGFVDGLDQFDASFFGIRPIEANMMDPRQRMLLETSWHALEDAGIDPVSLKGGRAGVFAGIGSSEYRDLITAAGRDDSYLGTAGSVALGRIAFALGLMGPAIPLDMTCASSLVAVHQAAASLRQSEVDVALAGGVHIILSRPVMRFMRDYGMLSRTGKCKTFDAAADGFVRGEGCGMVVLKRLTDAEAQGDRIWGVLKGSAINQNGAAAALTVPNGTAQEQLFAETLVQTGLAPSDLDYIEVHGTGSELGDPIEVRAAAAVYGRNRESDKPLLLGTVKTNIGHLEAAAGVAGLIKVLLSMHHEIIPKQLHFKNPSAHVDWDKLPVRVTSDKTVWPQRSDRLPVAGVSAFGISGTNAHVIVERAPARDDQQVVDGQEGFVAGTSQRIPVVLGDLIQDEAQMETSASRRTRLLPLSGKTHDALKNLADRYLDWLDGQQEALSSVEDAESKLLADMAWTASVGRSHFEHRAGITFNDCASLRESLLSVASQESEPERKPIGKLAFTFNGDYKQWVENVDELCNSEPVLQAVLSQCDQAFRDKYDDSLLEILNGDSKNWEKSAWTLPAVYSLECAFTALWNSLGIHPSVVVGYGVGELAAAQAAGVFSLEDGVRLAAWCGERAGSNEQDDQTQELEARLKEISLSPARFPFVSGSTTQMVDIGETPELATWFTLNTTAGQVSSCEAKLAKLGVDPEIEIRSTTEIVETVARLYEVGQELNFAGLFAGEMRRRISLPNYPFQRQSYWFNR
ncbi:MAG: SDR family NAD(P)-dependent oxidoreductase [Gammaproteobacteria bacterium]|nr:SDR family NAD(P)-dependent oxidoreductase [Gammaproteobacteria bacterium]